MGRDQYPYAIALLLAGCSFSSESEAMTSAGSSESGSSGSMAVSSSESSSGGDDPSSGSEGSSESSTGPSESSTGTSTGDACVPVEVLVGSFEVGETVTLQLDFDDFPGTPGDAEICMTFATPNAASGRTITIDEELLAFGPCGASPRPTYSICKQYTKPVGVVDVAIDNTTFAGCQNGAMDDVVLSFGCFDGTGSTGD